MAQRILFCNQISFPCLHLLLVLHLLLLLLIVRLLLLRFYSQHLNARTKLCNGKNLPEMLTICLIACLVASLLGCHFILSTSNTLLILQISNKCKLLNPLQPLFQALCLTIVLSVTQGNYNKACEKVFSGCIWAFKRQIKHIVYH